MIEKILIINFRSINKVEFSNLKNLTVFIGENNSGKSTVLNALRIINNLDYVPNKNDIRHGNNRFEITIVKKADEIFFYKLYEELIGTELHQNFVEYFQSGREKNRQTGTKIYRNEFRKFILNKVFSERRFEKLGLKIEVKLNSNDEISKQYKITDSRFQDLNIKSELVLDALTRTFVVDIANIEDERKFSDEMSGEHKSITNSVFGLLLESLDQSQKDTIEEIHEKRAKDLTISEVNTLLTEKMNKRSDQFLKTINDKFSNYMDGVLYVSWDFQDSLKSRINLETKFLNKSNKPLDFMSTGSGTRSLYILSLLESYMEEINVNFGNFGLFLIEEPELYLYPKIERKMGKIIKGISKNNQVFLTSHSSNLTSQFEKENIFVVRTNNLRGDMISEYNKLDTYNELVDLLGFNSHPIVNKRYIIMVEGTTDLKSYESVIKSHFPKHFEDCGFIFINGVRNVEMAITVQLIKNSNLINKLFIIRDSDGRKMEVIRNQYDEALKNIIVRSELDELLDERLYLTENAMNLECLSYTYDNVNFQKCPNYDEKLDDFIKNNMDDIEVYMNQTHNKKEIYSEEERNSFRHILINGSIEDKLVVLKEKLLFKELNKKYKKDVYKHDLIHEKDISYQSIYLNTLLTKLTNMFE